MVRVNERTSIAITWTPVRGSRRRVVFEPRNAGEWNRITKECRDDDWVATGSEIVAGLEFAGGIPVVGSNPGP